MAGIIKHAQAIKALLSAVQGTAAYQKTLDAQSRSLAAAIDNATFSLEEATGLIEELKAFPDAEKTMLTAKATERIAAPSQKITRHCLQDFCFVPHYLTEATWNLLQDDSEPTHVKLDALLQAAIHLGMKCPSETSMQTICAMHLLLEGKKKALGLSPAMKLQMARNVKAKFRIMLQRLQICLPLTYVQALPQSATIYKDSFPEWWQVAFADRAPIPSRIEAHELHEMMACIPMRGSRGDSGSMDIVNSSSSSGSAAPDVMQVMMQIAKAFGLQQSQPTLHIMERKPEESRVIKRLQSRFQLENIQPPPLQIQLDEAGAEQQVVVPTNVPAVSVTAPAEVELTAPAQVQKRLTALEATAAVMKAIADKNLGKKATENIATDKATAKSKAKAKAKPQAKHKAEPKAKAKPQAKHKAEQHSSKRKAEDNKQKKNATWSFERTRNQILCRTGLTGAGQSKTIKGVGPASVKKANEWLAEQRS
jgi:hypothetical protein